MEPITSGSRPHRWPAVFHTLDSPRLLGTARLLRALCRSSRK